MPLVSVLLLLFTFASGKVLTKNFLSPFLDSRGGILLVYLLGFLGFVVSFWWSTHQQSQRRRFIVVAATALLIVGMTTLRHSFLRQNHPTLIHDGAIQTEVAADFLLQGKNPYTENFRPTAFGQAPSPYNPTAENIAWTHYAYPPGVILAAIPNILLRPWFGPLSDLRWTYIGVLILLSVVLALRQSSWERRSLVVLFLLLNPFVWLYAEAGFNDILAAATMIFTVVAFEKKRWVWSGVLFGVALAMKQTVWLTIPLWLAWVWFSTHYQQRNQDRRRVLLAALITAAALYVPFLIWNASALYDDLVRYVSGSIPFSYPISGSTWLQFLRILHYVDSPWTVVATWPFQALVGIPIIIFGWRWIRRQATGYAWLAASAVLTLGVGMMSRFFNDNYLSGILVLAIGAYFLHYDVQSNKS